MHRPSDDARVRLTTAIEAYLAHLRALNRRPDTIRYRRQQLHRFAREGGTTRLDHVTLERVEAWIASHEWAPSTHRSHVAALRGLTRFAAARGMIDRDPLATMEAAGAPRPNPRPVPDDGYRFALQVAGDRERLMLRLAAEAGLRRGEVARARRSDVWQDLGGWSIDIDGKGGKARTVPLKDDLASELLARPDGYLFPGNTDGHLSPWWVGVLVARLLPDGYSMHKLRTRFGTRAYDGTGDLVAVQELLGHASPTTTRAYVATNRDAMRRAVEAA